MNIVRATKAYAVVLNDLDEVTGKLDDLYADHPEVATVAALVDQIISCIEAGDTSGTLYLFSDGVPAEVWWTDERFANARMLVEAHWTWTSTVLRLQD